MQTNRPGPNAPQGPRNIWQEMFTKVQQALNKKNQKLNRSLNQMMLELKNISQQTKDEKLIGILQNSLNLNTYLTNRKRIEKEWNDRIQQIYKFLCDETSESLTAVSKEWEKHLYNQQTNVKCFLEQIKIVKNIKDYHLKYTHLFR